MLERTKKLVNAQMDYLKKLKGSEQPDTGNNKIKASTTLRDLKLITIAIAGTLTVSHILHVEQEQKLLNQRVTEIEARFQGYAPQRASYNLYSTLPDLDLGRERNEGINYKNDKEETKWVTLPPAI